MERNQTRTASWPLLALALLATAGCKGDLDVSKVPGKDTIVQALKQTAESVSNASSSAAFIRLGFCLVDHNGDSVLDVAGLSSDGNRGPAVVLDGRTGAVLWRGGNYLYGGHLLCPNTNTFIVNDKDSWEVSIRSAKNPGTEKIVRLSDAPTEYGFGQGCVAVETKSGKTQGFSLADGSDMSCKTPWMKGASDTQDIHPFGPWHGELGQAKYDVRARKPGTPVLTASAKGEFSWAQELPYHADYQVAALTDELLFTAGHRVSSQSKAAFLVGLDRKTGESRYERQLCNRNLGVAGMRQNGSTLLVLEGWSGLWAFDIHTGRVLWRAGECIYG